MINVESRFIPSTRFYQVPKNGIPVILFNNLIDYSFKHPYILID